jgi:large subunit ribosomal protein L17
MRHQKAGRKFDRVRKQRKALKSMLLSSLILHERMQTTEAKAKETKDLIDKVINKAKKMTDANKVAIIRDLRKSLPLVAVKKLSGDFRNKFSKRTSGYTRIIKLPNRKSDGARMAIIEFV